MVSQPDKVIPIVGLVLPFRIWHPQTPMCGSLPLYTLSTKSKKGLESCELDLVATKLYIKNKNSRDGCPDETSQKVRFNIKP